ncbi:glycoside hydrolase family 25 protein [Clostridium sp. 'White wine YQ']|uniref:glycoside hydrolase family 25 protein n=1 Tax=Clostridium sp. 'White wine YQ' TaxID=3027474 RepID=UPI00236725DA|nr:glycoside hydrolase family 25 protein [Clostridium sp. 'White wine YQ']MDD7792814.1 glycoside hydrolase family 25 protein [Clostridium sp. 'White wine YQ']
MQDKNPRSLFGLDINEYTQGVNFQVIARSYDFLYLRASGSSTGTFRVDKKFIDFAKSSRNYGIPVGAYHYALPSYDLTTADSQCDNFINTLQLGFGNRDYGDLFPVLDVEAPQDKSISTAGLINWVDRFRKRFEKKTNRRLMLYTGTFFIDIYNNFYIPGRGYPLSDMPLWIAMYREIPGNPPIPPNVGGWTRWRIWQYTEKGVAKGANPPNDLNWGPDNIAYLMPPAIVQGLFATMDSNNIYVTWKPNTEPDLNGYNIFVNGEYYTTTDKNQNRVVIPIRKLNIPQNQSIKIEIHAFDKDREISKRRSAYILNPLSRESKVDNNQIYFSGEYLFFT